MIFGMNKKLYKMLCLNFNKELDKDMYEFLSEELIDYDPYYVEQAIKKIIREDRFFPNISRILDVIKSIPTHYFSEEEKIQRWSEHNIRPKWLDKELANE
jgi:hypothetical protein